MPLAHKEVRIADEPISKPHLYREDESSEIPENLFNLHSLFPQPHPAARMACRWGGLFFLTISVIGFFAGDLLRVHLTSAHNYLHLINGLILGMIGMKGNPALVRITSFCFGSAYFLLGITGFFIGGSDNLMVLLPERLELGVNDHIFHILIGVLFLFAGIRSYRKYYQSWT